MSGNSCGGVELWGFRDLAVIVYITPIQWGVEWEQKGEKDEGIRKSA
jgi:hypothetical protein